MTKKTKRVVASKRPKVRRPSVQFLMKRIRALEDQREQLQVQLAGCGVAALGYATGKNSCNEGDYGWSASFDDVMRLRKKYEYLLSAPPPKDSETGPLPETTKDSLAETKTPTPAPIAPLITEIQSCPHGLKRKFFELGDPMPCERTDLHVHHSAEGHVWIDGALWDRILVNGVWHRPQKGTL